MKKTLLIAGLAVCAVAFSMKGTSTNAAAPDCSTLTFITESLPAFFVGTPANFQIEASGGTPPYRFKITTGALPPNLSMDSDGLITGTPTMAANTTIFVRLKDHGPCTVTQAFQVSVEP